MKKYLMILLYCGIFSGSYVFSAESKFQEKHYQKLWCAQHNGIIEHVNTDKTRVDCLTATEAVEFDFANKWAECIGQALYYASITGKRAKVVLILNNPEKEMRYFNRVKILSEKYNFEVEYITEDILNFKFFHPLRQHWFD